MRDNVESMDRDFAKGKKQIINEYIKKAKG